MAGGEWNTSRERKQQATDAREADRERIRLEKRQLRDFRWSAERSTLRESDWRDLVVCIKITAKRASTNFGWNWSPTGAVASF
jgi:hypothetical protein